MRLTPEQRSAWQNWLLATSIPLVQLGNTDQMLGVGSGTMIGHEGRRFIVTAGHVAKLDSKGWAIVVQQHFDGRLEFYKPHAFVHVGEFSRAEASLRTLDLCAAQVAPDLETWYEHRTPRGLFDKRLHHVFDAGALAPPKPDQLFGFSGRVPYRETRPSDIRVGDYGVTWPHLCAKRRRGTSFRFTRPASRSRSNSRHQRVSDVRLLKTAGGDRGWWKH